MRWMTIIYNKGALEAIFRLLKLGIKNVAVWVAVFVKDLVGLARGVFVAVAFAVAERVHWQ